MKPCVPLPPEVRCLLGNGCCADAEQRNTGSNSGELLLGSLSGSSPGDCVFRCCLELYVPW